MKTIIYLMMIIIMANIVLAISCNYDENPYLKKDIDWVCEVSSQSKCYGAIFYNNSLISISPGIKEITDIGRIDYFESKGMIVNIKFRKKDLYEGIPYNFSVFCFSNSSVEYYSDEITPQYNDLREIVYRGIFVKENVSYIIAVISLLCLASIPIIYIVKK